MKWISAKERLSTHMINVCCKRIRYTAGWFTAYYDGSRKVYVNDNLFGPHGLKPEEVEWLDESDETPPTQLSDEEIEDMINKGATDHSDDYTGIYERRINAYNDFTAGANYFKTTILPLILNDKK